MGWSYYLIRRPTGLNKNNQGTSVNSKDSHPELDFTRISVLYANTNLGYFGIATGVFFFAYTIN